MKHLKSDFHPFGSSSVKPMPLEAWYQGCFRVPKSSSCFSCLTLSSFGCQDNLDTVASSIMPQLLWRSLKFSRIEAKLFDLPDFVDIADSGGTKRDFYPVVTDSGSVRTTIQELCVFPRSDGLNQHDWWTIITKSVITVIPGALADKRNLYCT